MHPSTSPYRIYSYASTLATGFLAAALAAAPAQAGQVTIDFEDTSGNVVVTDYVKDGFRFSPNCHRDAQLGPTGTWMGWDSSSCSFNRPGAPPSYNVDFLGPASLKPAGADRLYSAYMYLDYSGALFSLLQVDLVPEGGMMFASSKGGTLRAPDGAGIFTLTFSGDVWSNVEWVLIGPVNAGFPIGIDNVVLDNLTVPEPMTSALVLAALGLLVGLRRRVR